MAPSAHFLRHVYVQVVAKTPYSLVGDLASHLKNSEVVVGLFYATALACLADTYFCVR